MNEDDKLRIISNETKDSINQMSVVTPSIYASIFAKLAQNHNATIEDEKELSKDILQMECSALTTLQDKTAKNAQVLSLSTTKAISAIQDKDESTLNEVLKETKALRSEIEKLKESVYKDELTHVFNRKWFHDTYINPENSTFKKAGTLAMIDLNYFKIVNDTHGHVIGDKVLLFIANELKKSGFDTVRYGGDEFIMLFPKNYTEEKVLELLNKRRDEIITKKLKAHNTMFKASFSIGVSKYTTGNLMTKVIAMADKNMYIDKQKIKKRIPGIEI